MEKFVENKKLSIICFSSEYDKLLAAFTLASGAAAVNYEVNMFFTFWGLNVIKKTLYRKPSGKGFFARSINYISGSRNNLRLSRFNFMGISLKLLKMLMRKRNVATLNTLIEASIALQINLYICEMSLSIFGNQKSDYIPQIKEIIGVAKFLEYSAGGERIFI